MKHGLNGNCVKNGAMVMTIDETAILKQALANYQELWNDFLNDIDDGRWNRAEVEHNIVQCKQILSFDHDT